MKDLFVVLSYFGIVLAPVIAAWSAIGQGRRAAEIGNENSPARAPHSGGSRNE